jgi:hypothetical protein
LFYKTRKLASGAESIFALRLKKNENIQQNSVFAELNNLGLKRRISLFLEGVSITKQKGFGPFNLSEKWQRTYKDFVADEGWFILTNLDSLEAAVNDHIPG